jgi:hypothetical protein
MEDALRIENSTHLRSEGSRTEREEPMVLVFGTSQYRGASGLATVGSSTESGPEHPPLEFWSASREFMERLSDCSDPFGGGGIPLALGVAAYTGVLAALHVELQCLLSSYVSWYEPAVTAQPYVLGDRNPAVRGPAA